MSRVGAGVTEPYSVHSLKHRFVQLYMPLGVRDENVMETIQMRGPNAYANYCAAYNDCGPTSLRRDTNYDDFIKHARTLIKEEKFRLDHAGHFYYEIDI